MKYELAKELKDAGYPVGYSDKDYQIGFVANLDARNGQHADYFTGLSLSELIEACGENLESIIQRGNGEGDNWETRSKTTRYNATTIEEAVARLWLALNKKI